MRFNFLWIGKTREKNWKALQEDYLTRLSHFVSCSVTELRDKGGDKAVEKEGESIIAAIEPASYVVLLDVSGDQYSSADLAKKIGSWQVSGMKSISFVIGGAQGVSPQVAERADHRLSLSFLTFTHEMARVVLLEQLYRAFTIIRGFPYQK